MPDGRSAPLTSDQPDEELSFVAQAVFPEEMARFFRRSEVYFGVFKVFLNWISNTGEVFLRYNFGERVLTWSKIFVSWLALRIFIFFSVTIINFLTDVQMELVDFNRNFDMTPPSADSTLLEVFTLLFVVVAVIHRLQVMRRNLMGQQWHSYGLGRSWLQDLGIGGWLDGRTITIPSVGTLVIPINHWFYYCWLEPALVFGLGLVLYNHVTVFALWLLVTGGAMFVKNQALYVEHRGFVLDAIDARLEKQYIQETADPKNTEKWHFPGIAQPVAVPFVSASAVTSANVADVVAETIGDIAVQLQRTQRHVSTPADVADIVRETVGGETGE